MTTLETFKRINWVAVLGAAGLLVSGCAVDSYTGNGGNDLGNPNPNPTADDDDDVDDPYAPLGTTLSGVVLNSMSMPLEGVTVATDTGLETVTDDDGRYSFLDLTPQDHVLVNFYKTGYAKTQAPIDILDEVENTLIQRMAEVDYTNTFDAADGLAFVVSERAAEVMLPPANFVDAEGSIYDGSITVEATFFDVTAPVDNGGELLATPGDFSAITASGDEELLESWGMLQVNLWGENGEELELGDVSAPIRFPLQIQDAENASVPEGDSVAAWSYDEDLGKWVEEGAGNLVQDDNGIWYWEFEAPHFSSWNCDQPLPTHGCVSGQVTNSQGTPRVGATVRAVGLTYTYTTTGRTGQDGRFCVEVKNGETVWLDISYTIGGQPATQRTDPVTTGTQATCTDGNSADCVDIGTVPIDIMTCVSGVVVDSQGQGLADQTVVSPNGGVSQTEADGSFCMAVPVFTTTQVYVVSGRDEVGFQPTQVFAQAGLPGCQSGCPNLAILRPYQETTCAAGAVMINNQQAEMVPVEVFDNAFNDVAVYSTTTESNGGYCIEVPVTEAGVTVRVGNEQNMCGEEDLDTLNAGGGTCDDDPFSQNGECLQVPTFSCNL